MRGFSKKLFSGCGVAGAIALALLLFSSSSLLTGCSALGLTYSLTGLSISPATGDTTIVAGVTAQFTATGTYTEGGHQPTTQNLTDQVQWSTTIPDVAVVSDQGVVTGVAAGTTTVTATIEGEFGELTATSNVTVTAPSGGGGTTTRALTSVALVPADQALTGIGQQAQFLAIGAYNTSPTSANLTSTATWQSSDDSVATVGTGSNNPGLVTAVSAGTATITALANSPDGSVVEANGTVTVTLPTGSSSTTRTLTAITVSPGSQTLTAAGQTAQLIAIGSYTASPLTVDLTSTASWESSDTSIATVNSSGIVTAVAPGSATITAIGTAADGSIITGDAVMTVAATTPNGRILTGLSVIPASQDTSTAGETSQFLAIGTYSAAPLSADLTDQVTWVSSDIAVATVNNAGLATTVGGAAGGETTITALATASDGSVFSASGTLSIAPASTPGAGSTNLPTLTLYGVGAGDGSMTSSPGAISCSYTGPASGSGSGTETPSPCIGNFSTGTTVTLTETPASGTKFDGWSNNCAPVTTSPTDPTSGQYTECTITMNSDETVGAIFDPQ